MSQWNRGCDVMELPPLFSASSLCLGHDKPGVMEGWKQHRSDGGITVK